MADDDRRRELEREALRVPAFIVEIRDGVRTIHGVSRDISPKGIFVETDEQVAPGTEIQLFVGSSSPALRAFAKVVRAEPGRGFAAAFLDDSEKSRASVAAFLKTMKRGR